MMPPKRSAGEKDQLAVDAFDAKEQFPVFFDRQIQAANTRNAYARAISLFATWCQDRQIAFRSAGRLEAESYLSEHNGSPRTIQQHVSALNKFFEWLVLTGESASNPFAQVGTPAVAVGKKQRPRLGSEDATALIQSIEGDSEKDIRDRALVTLMLDTDIRVSSIVTLQRQDYWQLNGKGQIQVHARRKGSKKYNLSDFTTACMKEYLHAREPEEEPEAPLFRRSSRNGQLLPLPLTRDGVFKIVRGRTETAAMLDKHITPDSLRLTRVDFDATPPRMGAHPVGSTYPLPGNRAAALSGNKPLLNTWVVENDGDFLTKMLGQLKFLDGIQCSYDTGYGKSAIDKIKHGLRPDVVFMDTRLPDIDSIEAVRLIKQLDSRIQIVALAKDDNDTRLLPMLMAGACNYLLRSSPSTEIHAILKATENIGAPVSSHTVNRIVHLFTNKMFAAQQGTRNAGGSYKLSERERQICALFTRGKSNKDIAAITHTSEHTIDSHTRSIYRKMGVNNRALLIAKVLSENVLRPTDYAFARSA